MSDRRRALPSGPLAAGLVLAIALCSALTSAQPADPFERLRGLTGTPTLVPARALAVIPERNTERPLRIVDTLAGIDPQFDEVARGAGLSPQRAIQIRTREANIPIFVAKNEATISTVLQIELGARIEVLGVLVERGDRYLFLASAVRPARQER